MKCTSLVGVMIMETLTEDTATIMDRSYINSTLEEMMQKHITHLLATAAVAVAAAAEMELAVEVAADTSTILAEDKTSIP